MVIYNKDVILNQFLKRKLKEKSEVKPVEMPDIVEGPVPVQVPELTALIENAAIGVLPSPELIAAVQVALPFTGFDIFYDTATRQHKAIIFKYNPDTMAIHVEGIRPVSRQVALGYDIQKQALKTLIKIK